MKLEFTAHNISLDDGTCTRPAAEGFIEDDPRFLSSKRLIKSLCLGDLAKLRVADLGCLEGGFSVGFARMGLQTLGIEVRDSNVKACQYVKERVDLPNLEFVQDDVRNLGRYGKFDVVFCCGVLYHLENPLEFLNLIGQVTTKLLILDTHFSDEFSLFGFPMPLLFRKVLQRLPGASSVKHFALSPLTKHEGLEGRWFSEFRSDRALQRQEQARWAAWNNRRSFWPTRAALLDAIYRSGFDLVMQQFDHLGPSISQSMKGRYFRSSNRRLFVGIKSDAIV